MEGESKSCVDEDGGMLCADKGVNAVDVEGVGVASEATGILGANVTSLEGSKPLGRRRRGGGDGARNSGKMDSFHEG